MSHKMLFRMPWWLFPSLAFLLGPFVHVYLPWQGLIALSWWQGLLVAVALAEITIMSVTIFLHRGQAHRSVEFTVPAPLLVRSLVWMLFKYDMPTWAPAGHFFRFWLWITTGMVTKEWVAIHRKHHAKVETHEDPHSPVHKGIWQIVFNGVKYYRDALCNKEDIEKYGRGTPDDWFERNIYTRWWGVLLMLAIDLLCFDGIGLFIWGVQMLWIPFWAAGGINGIGHWFGYRNFHSINRREGTVDRSTNIVPFAVWIGGEELHNNHHGTEWSAKFSKYWYELDIGWEVLRVLHLFRLLRIKYVARAVSSIENPGATLDRNGRAFVRKDY